MFRDELVDLIVTRLQEDKTTAREFFMQSKKDVGVRYCYIENLLPEDIAKKIYSVFPSLGQMRLMSSFRERKYTSKHFDQFNSILKDITFAMQDVAVVKVIEEITGITQQIPDPTLYAGGLSMMGEGHFLNPHIDNSHEVSRRYYRTLNLLYYVTPDWEIQNGGNLELWEKSVRENVVIHSKFNRLVLMETTPTSWHSVSPIIVPKLRCCVSNYYFSPVSPIKQDYFNVTSFSARPEQTFRRTAAWIDNGLRQAVRAIFPDGVGAKDLYKGDK
ncbi:2OG-Fe(II) oxygenase [Solimicrobium silvestre]|uniref:2OG-Fe(II) oxygenase superfamily n=1 Tax=Solimicrobium silvestre TaxID=2099400 RepID=A0A2S9GYG9_9BURK|nr:2OG-Fe(II) oxygenase [Solimicrobium silvestre]PRC92706.1 2OG-Fe(II) oxygenase superfamily [Solimicrobium silvestre]